VHLAHSEGHSIAVLGAPPLGREQRGACLTPKVAEVTDPGISAGIVAALIINRNWRLSQAVLVFDRCPDAGASRLPLGAAPGRTCITSGCAGSASLSSAAQASTAHATACRTATAEPRVRFAANPPVRDASAAAARGPRDEGCTRFWI
jgi:hypothetical protein